MAKAPRILIICGAFVFFLFIKSILFLCKDKDGKHYKENEVQVICVRLWEWQR